MKVICQLARRNLKYTIGLVAMFLFVLQVYNIVSEVKLETVRLEELEEPKMNKESTTLLSEETPSENQCSEGNLKSEIWMGVMKCSLAFLFGGLFSEMRFIKFGII